MQNEFLTYEQALALKELGFDEPCLAWYVTKEYGLEFGKVIQSDLIKDAVIAPLKQQALRWFRENYGLLHAYIEGAFPWYRYHINSEDNEWEGYKELKYSEAENDLIDKLIEIVKSK